MSLKAGAFSRYRPRVLTFVVLIVVAAPTVLANLSSEIVLAIPYQGHENARGTYGWPLIWHWHNLFISPGPCGILSWDYSATRLAGNLAIWLIMLVAAGGTSEWLLRRYRPRLRWSLKTMLAAVGLVAVFCAWLVGERNRANLQDPMIAALVDDYQTVYVQRPGPKWFEFIAPDRYRRRIIGVEMQMYGGATLDEEFIQRLAQLPRLQHLQINVKHRTGPMVVALAGMRRLRSLRIDEYGSVNENEQTTRDFLAAIGTLHLLERLSLEDMTLSRESLGALAGLSKLESLWLEGGNDDEDLFAHLPVLPRLKAIDFGYAQLSNQALRRLSAFPQLRAINLSDAKLSPDADLAALASLEELAIDARMLSAVGAESFGTLKCLKTLHISDNLRSDQPGSTTLDLDRGNVSVLQREAEGARRALQTLRRANPGITIDTDRDFMLSNLVLIPPGLQEAELASTWLPALLPP